MDFAMECPEVKVEKEHLEPLIIIEEGDEIMSIMDRGSCEEDAKQQDGQIGITNHGIEEDGENGKDDILMEFQLKGEIGAGEEERGTQGDEEHSDGGRLEETREDGEKGELIQEGMEMVEITDTNIHAEQEMEMDTPTQGQQDDINGSLPSDQSPKDTLSPVDAQKQARRLTPDFPDSLYELLCMLQEGRRLNDQRCSFSMEIGRRRRCHSEPTNTMPAKRVIFSSMTSLQKEEFFSFVAASQGRRLDEQRADLHNNPPPKPKASKFKGSIRLTMGKKSTPIAVPKEDLYNMILTSQNKGRLEEQRSVAPGPMDDEDFFSLLLRVQGGRMDEQRTELPGNSGPEGQRR